MSEFPKPSEARLQRCERLCGIPVDEPAVGWSHHPACAYAPRLSLPEAAPAPTDLRDAVVRAGVESARPPAWTDVADAVLAVVAAHQATAIATARREALLWAADECRGNGPITRDDVRGWLRRMAAEDPS